MVAKPIRIGSHFFLRQRDAIEHFSGMLSRYKVASVISGSDADDLLALLRMHQDVAEKLGVGLQFFTTIISGQGTKCFAVMRTDGTASGFSFHRCIKQNWS